MSAAEAFEALRARLTGVAYGMLGTWADAEDVVQEAYLRWHDADRAQIRSPEAWLTTVVTRLAIDRLRSAQQRRETYVGPWLPEPLVATADDPAEAVEAADVLRLGLLAALERLNPVERAVLLLRDVFDLDYAEVADAVGRTPANCRQIAVRARERIGRPVRRFEPAPADERELAEAFAAAVNEGDLARLAGLLASDAVLWSDGGGVERAARRPVHGADKVARFLTRIARLAPPDLSVTPARVNGEAGFRLDSAGRPTSVIALEIADGAIAGVRIVVNPEKLAHL